MEFRPELSVGVFHDGNIDVVGGAQGDEVAALSFDLAWDRNTPATTFSLSYRPSFVFYRQASDLNYFGNRLVVDFTKETSQDSKIKVGAFFTRTDYQGQTVDSADRATTFLPRSTQTLTGVTVDGTVPAGRRGLLDWNLRGGFDLYEDAPADPSAGRPDPIDFNDGTWVGGSVDWRREISTRNTLGLGLGLAYFGYENTAGVVGGSFGLVGTSELGPSWTLDYALGVSRATSDGEANDGFAFDVKVDYKAGEDSSFRAGVRRGYSPGRGLGSATQDLGGWISYSHTTAARGLTGSIVGGYWQRDAIQGSPSSSSGDTETTYVNGSLGWVFNRYVALEVAYAYSDQHGANGADPAFDTNYNSYGLYLRWAIRGR